MHFAFRDGSFGHARQHTASGWAPPSLGPSGGVDGGMVQAFEELSNGERSKLIRSRPCIAWAS
jgi:hypothetical protein